MHFLMEYHPKTVLLLPFEKLSKVKYVTFYEDFL